MTTIKKDTIKAKVFEKKMIGLIKMVKLMEMPEHTRTILLDELRHVHNGCLEWEAPKETPEDAFLIIEELR